MSSDIDRVSGWWVFAAVLLLIAGVANVIYGIAALGDSRFFTENVTLIATDLNTYGWIILVIGVIQLTAGASLLGGGGWGRFVGVVAAGLNAIAYLVTINAAPFWSLCAFILSVVILYELLKPQPA
ncbi:MAG: hypothetical protein QM648_01140 [Solirubrobacterales bacterium]